MANPDDDDFKPLDMAVVNRAVSKQDFETLQQLSVESMHVGNDLVILLGMCAMHNTMIRAMFGEIQELKRLLAAKETVQ